ncbi:MAG: hypothetical protein FD121_310 [Gallionellaceae bacterium]|nr:MAG: hypothetical protein FD121_310 [Gallionellaceae bacterium]
MATTSFAPAVAARVKSRDDFLMDRLAELNGGNDELVG